MSLQQLVMQFWAELFGPWYYVVSVPVFLASFYYHLIYRPRRRREEVID